MNPSTPAFATVTNSTASPVPAGYRKVMFIFSSDFAGTVLGATFAGAADSSLTISAPTGLKLTAIAYTVTAGTARILTLT